MKTFKYLTIVLLAAGLFQTTQAQNQSATELHLQGSKFLNPLLEKWIAEYSRTHSQVKITINNTADQQPADASIELTTNESITNNDRIVYGGRYALLPVVNKNNPLLSDINRHGVDKKLLKRIYFEKDIFNETETSKDDQKWSRLNVYTRSAQAGSSQLFATYFGDEATRLRGKKINGDDLFLVSAIRRDSLGLSFNHLGYLFDLNNRQLKEGILPLPIELGDKRSDKYIINETITVDQLIKTLENSQSDLVPVARFGFKYNTAGSKAEQLDDFFKWVATDGQIYNQSFGFLSLDAQAVAQQTKFWNDNLITSR